MSRWLLTAGLAATVVFTTLLATTARARAQTPATRRHSRFAT
jgi:fructoselysine-6-P-deglycase FrlB-like protein